PWRYRLCNFFSCYTIFKVFTISIWKLYSYHSSSSPLINSKIKTPIPYIKRNECAFVVPPSFSKNKNDLTSLSFSRKNIVAIYSLVPFHSSKVVIISSGYLKLLAVVIVFYVVFMY